MKKQIKKLTINKKTISNLSASEMNRQLGGGPANGNHGAEGGPTKNGNTCFTHRCPFF